MSIQPYAYCGVLLHDHLVLVGASVSTLFAKRFTAAGRLARELNNVLGINDSLISIASLAGALHDIGKASPYYQVNASLRSFLGHEFVGAFILYELYRHYYLLGKEEVGVASLLSAWAIARHHVAMSGRHPLDLMNSDGKLVDVIVRAIEKLRGNEHYVSNSLPKPVKKLIGIDLEHVLREMVRHSWERDRVREYALGLIRLPNTNPFSKLQSKWQAYVSVIAGAVIVADTLVAEVEGRETDDLSKPYSNWWKKELSNSVSTLRRLSSNLGLANSILSNALKSLSKVFK